MNGVRHALASLRWRLSLTFVAILAVLLAALGTYQYFALRASLISSRSQSLANDYNTARAVISRLAASTSTTAPRGRLLCARAPTLVARTVAVIVANVTGHSVNVVVYDPNLSVAATIPVDASPPHLDAATLDDVVTTGRRSATQVVSGGGSDDLVIGFPINVGSATCGIAQVSTSMAPIDQVLGDDVAQLAIGGSVTLLLALLLGLLLTGRMLRPLHRVSATAEQLAGGDLRARSHLPPRGDEVGVLAQSFDNMADRIEAAFAAQRESEAQVRRFIADASHELRTPVTALKGYIDVLRRGAAHDPGVLDAALQTMGSEAERMRGLVLDLLTLARIDARRGTDVAPLDVDAELGAMLDEELRVTPAPVQRHLDSHARVLADRTALHTIVRNVLVNACKYAPAAAQHWITTVEEGRVRLDVRDEGPGIPSADLPHVFERFYRGEKTRAREEGGSGLGLSIVQGLARAQGGDVAIHSAEGMGTTVTVWLPLAPATN